MEVITLVVGSLQTNCYLVVDRRTQKTIIIDPADEADFISTTILEKKLIPTAIVLTHGHYDHCLGALELKLNFNLPIYLHPADLPLYQKATNSASYWSKNKYKNSKIRDLRSEILKLPPIDFHLTDNQTISFGKSCLKVIHTPGHTPGSCCFLIFSPVIPAKAGIHKSIPQHLFTGDTLFTSSTGSTNHKYSSKASLQKSLSRLKTIIQNQKHLLIYPAHEEYCFPLTSVSYIP